MWPLANAPLKNIQSILIVYKVSQNGQDFNPAFVGELRSKFSFGGHKQYNFFQLFKKGKMSSASPDVQVT